MHSRYACQNGMSAEASQGISGNIGTTWTWGNRQKRCINYLSAPLPRSSLGKRGGKGENSAFHLSPSGVCECGECTARDPEAARSSSQDLAQREHQPAVERGEVHVIRETVCDTPVCPDRQRNHQCPNALLCMLCVPSRSWPPIRNPQLYILDAT